MAVECSGDSVKLEMDSPSTQKSIKDKFKSNLFNIRICLVLLALVLWQIATNIKVQNIEDLLQQESEKLLLIN